MEPEGDHSTSDRRVSSVACSASWLAIDGNGEASTGAARLSGEMEPVPGPDAVLRAGHKMLASRASASTVDRRRRVWYDGGITFTDGFALRAVGQTYGAYTSAFVELGLKAEAPAPTDVHPPIRARDEG